MIPGAPAGKDPHRVELLARQADDQTVATRMYALEQVAVDGFPRVGGATITGLLGDGLIRKQPGRVPYALTLAGVDALIAHRTTEREANRC